MLQPLIPNWASPRPRPSACRQGCLPHAHLALIAAGCGPFRTAHRLSSASLASGVALPPSPDLALSVLHLRAAAPLRLQPAPARPAGAAGRVSPRGLLTEPRRASPLSPPAISPGFASPGDLRPIPDPGRPVSASSLHQA
ncbi:hypothetical protein NDU88_002094 [Pleurodeles waltl]|uniref:Uncharacterized protein n=1 Tax=Pleurodeles waltl TaxID=8319 RepID=A0AAV7Q856_PLEWA|nr:hypothetical protein NDU88_002094 [Pleurodeles waltl]